jgi:hypothetical protein
VEHQAAPVPGKPALMSPARVGVIRSRHGDRDCARCRRFARIRRARGSTGSYLDYRKRLWRDRTLVHRDDKAGRSATTSMRVHRARWTARDLVTGAHQIGEECPKTGGAFPTAGLVRALVLLLGFQVASDKHAVNARNVKILRGFNRWWDASRSMPEGTRCPAPTRRCCSIHESEPPPDQHGAFLAI